VVAGEHVVSPPAADFEDGYCAAEVCDAIIRSGDTRAAGDGLVSHDVGRWTERFSSWEGV